MKYLNTRSRRDKAVPSAYAIKKGLCEGGGLYMPESIPEIDGDFLKSLLELGYAERAAKILSLFLTDYSEEELYEDARAAYTEEKFTPSPAPVTLLRDGIHMLELWHGPTSAFKDMALQIMPRLFVRALRKCGESDEAMILVATSGDTGKAALEGYKNVSGTRVKVFYPIEGVSEVQKRQMQSQDGDNLSVVGIRGNFDDAQSGVKAIFADRESAERLRECGIFLSSANSINWGRLAPQIVYYVSAYCDLCRVGKIKFGDTLDVCVPTGNFGNIFAAFIAKKMGVPLGKLICASNENDVLREFFDSGVYDKNREFYKTISPSMDILISSNLERLIYTMFGAERCAECMEALNRDGRYSLTAEELEAVSHHFVGYSATEEECRAEIRRAYECDGRLIDTHTAVAAVAAEKYKKEHGKAPMLLVSTASAYKFAADVLSSLGEEECENALDAPAILEEKTGTTMPLPLRNALTRAPRHTEVIDRADMLGSVIGFAKRD